MPLAQKFRAEHQPCAGMLFQHALGESHRHGGFDGHVRAGIDGQHLLDHTLDGGSVEIIEMRVIVGRCGDDHPVRLPVGLRRIERGGEVQLVPGEIRLDIRVLNGRLAAAQLVHPRGVYIHGGHMVPLR